MTKERPLIRVERCDRAGCRKPGCKDLAVILLRPSFSERADGVLIPYVALSKDEVRQVIHELAELEKEMEWGL